MARLLQALPPSSAAAAPYAFLATIAKEGGGIGTTHRQAYDTTHSNSYGPRYTMLSTAIPSPPTALPTPSSQPSPRRAEA